MLLWVGCGSAEKTENHRVLISTDIEARDGLCGEFVVGTQWPGKPTKDGYDVGEYWMTDVGDAECFEDRWQGAATVRKWRKEVLDDWEPSWQVLKNHE